MDILDSVFWWIGLLVCSAGAVMLVAFIVLLIGYGCFRICVSMRIAGLVRLQTWPYMDTPALRAFGRFRYAWAMLFDGIPDELRGKDGSVIFLREWIKTGGPDQ